MSPNMTRRGRTLFDMGRHAREIEQQEQEKEQEQDNDESVSAPLDLNPLRDAGWSFRNGYCTALERQKEKLGSRGAAD